MKKTNKQLQTYNR